jgi:hypothetical protein
MRKFFVAVGAVAIFLATAPAGYAQPFYNTFQGASWTPGFYPMDLAAAVADPNSSFPKAGNYLTQLTNDGIFVFNKLTRAPLYVQDLWDFWCSGSPPLAGCTSSASAGAPYDTQIAYNWQDARWLVASLSPTGPETGPANPQGGGSYLFVGASETASPSDSYYQFPVEACSDISGTFGDNPIMGISHYSAGTVVGRVVVDVLCFSTTTGLYAGEEIYDFGLYGLEHNKLNDKRFITATLYGAPKLLRPRQHLGTGNVVPLSSVFVNSSGYPMLSVYRLTPQSSITSDAIQFYNSYTGSIPVSSDPAPHGPQPGTTAVIDTDDLDPDNGNMMTNVYSGSSDDNVFATSFTAALPDGTDSVLYLFDLNLSTGAVQLESEGFLSGQLSYSAAQIDNDNELTVNYTVFSSSVDPTAYLELWDNFPVKTPPVLEGTWPLVASSAPLTSTCNSSNVCRWGDYTANVFDYSCAAANAGLTPECYMFWQTTEYTPDGSSQYSNVTSVYDEVLSNDTE